MSSTLIMAAMSSWKNSATVVLIGKLASNNIQTTPVHNGKQIIKTLSDKNYNYGFLLLKRGRENKFMPNSYVFPGGALDKWDFSLKWRSIFTKNECERLMTKFTLQNTPRPFVFSDESFKNAGSPMPDDENNSIPMEIATRICAIRETFEESGILLARKQIPDDEKLPLKYGEIFEDEDLLGQWQKKVSADGEEFIKLCEEKRIYPDIWSLHEWSYWLTPTTYKKRFNTVFYTCFLNSTPDHKADNQEISVAEWYSPNRAFNEFFAGKIHLPPPQNYEISGLAQFESIDELASFSMKRSLLGVEWYLPVVVFTLDGVIQVLPGDDLYPNQPDYFGKNEQIKLEKSIKELNEESKNFNRGFRLKDTASFDFRYKCNVKSKYNQLRPIPFE